MARRAESGGSADIAVGAPAALTRGVPTTIPGFGMVSGLSNP